MKRIRITEIIATIRVNLVSFLSISMFVCLGVGLFLGIQWGSTALVNRAEQTMDEGRLHDFEISFPYGITDDDLAKLKGIDGVDEVETGYSTFVTMLSGNTSYVLKFQTMNKNIDMPTKVNGEMPKKNDEVALLEFWASTHDIHVGDTITLKHDAVEGDGMEYLSGDKFKVTALVENPSYFFKQTTALGVSNLGSGAVDCVAFVTTEALNLNKFSNNVTSVFIRSNKLRGLSTFSKEYDEISKPITDAITELGGTLGSEQYHKVYGEAKDKVDDAERQVNDGESQLADARKLIEEGDAAITSGDAQRKLDEAYKTLVESQAKYDAGLESYQTASSLYNQISSSFASVEGPYNELVSLYYSVGQLNNVTAADAGALGSALETFNANPDYPGGANWQGVESTFDSLSGSYGSLLSGYNSLSNDLSSVGGALGVPVSAGEMGSLPSVITPDTANDVLNTASGAIDSANSILDSIGRATITVGNYNIALLDIPNGLSMVGSDLASTKQTLDTSKAQLDAGWDEYYANVDLLEKNKNDLAEGKKTLAEKEADLEDGKRKLQDGKDLLSKLEEYEWVVMPRRDNGSVQGLKRISAMMTSVRWAMALLFILVGLFVCYSAISRLIHEAIVQVGTKKAMGFRSREIASLYMWFAGCAVVVGVLLSVLLGVFVVQGIMNPKAAKQFALPDYPPYVGWTDLLIMGLIELVLILASTWIAIRSMLKRHAVDLLRGETVAAAKERFYEKWRIWQRMSLFSQTVVNNCVNDTRRVVATLIGVIGCTTLIVTAVTLEVDIANSLTKHYQDVYSFDSIAYLDEGSEQKAENVAMALYRRGVTSSPAYKRTLQVRGQAGTRSIANIIVPTNMEAFKKMYHVNSLEGGEANLEADGIWLSAAYGEHMGVKTGDDITLTEYNGKTHTFKIAGFFEFYLLRHEFILSEEAYKEAFNVTPTSNILLVNSDGADVNSLRDTLMNADGYDMLFYDKDDASYAFNEMTEILTTVVLVYLGLSALMALMVLLNLDVMFVDEKKKELIVLMICGFGVKDAKAYIYRDSIVLTIIGIILGIVLGAVMGGITVFALEPDLGYWLKGFCPIAALVGAIGAGAFAAGVLIFSLRRIPRFELTDINRF